MSGARRGAGDSGCASGCADILLPFKFTAFGLDEAEDGEGAGDEAWREGHSWSKSFQGALIERRSFLALRDAPACKGAAETGTTVVHCTCEPPS